jgi:hypothetical protein
MICPKCKIQMIGIEYGYNHPQRYDGVSEWLCESDNFRIGRWSKKELQENESELRYGGK